jgi:hypothetical protein
MRPRVTIFAIFAVIFLNAPALRAADAQWPAKLGTLTAKFFNIGTSNLVSKGAGSEVRPRDVESGFVGQSNQTYVDDGGFESTMTLLTYKDSSGAYQAYLFLRSQPTDDLIPGAVLVKGNRVLVVSQMRDKNRKSIEDWLRSISDGVASPPIATYLPDNGKVPRSERYALGPLAFGAAAKALGRNDVVPIVEYAGFGSHAEAIFAKYKSGKDEATLLLLEYPTPQLAELHLRHLQRALADAKLTDSSIERKGSLLSIVLAPTSAEYAAKLRGAVNYETQVTWNEPSSTATDPPIISTLVKIIIAIGVFMMVTLVLGIAFGGVRIITKRLFPGKVFDRKEQIEVLQLGLSGKPIDPSDMY